VAFASSKLRGLAYSGHGVVAVLQIIRELFRVRGAHDADTERRAQLLLESSVVLALFLIAARLTTAHDHRNPVLSNWVIPAAIAACLVTAALARRARVTSAAFLMASVTFAAIGAVAWTEGPSSPRLGNTVLVVAAIGCVMRPWLTIVFGAGLALMVAGLGWAQAAGLHAAVFQTDSPFWAPFLRQTVAVALVAVVLRRGYDRLLAQVVDRERACAHAVDAAQGFNSSLERRVAENTASLAATHDRLDRLASQLSESLTADLHGMRQRLAGFLAAEAALDPARLSDVVAAAAAAERLIAMIDRLHEHARLGVAALRPETVDMRALFSEVVADLGRSRAEVAIEWTIDPLPRAWVDPTLIRTVVENLLDNAVKFSRGRKPPRIHVGFAQPTHRYFVRDNGIGFDPRAAPKLFTPFQRLHGDAGFEGHGLGLANVRRIVHRSGGSVVAEAQPDHGAAIYFDLPRPADGDGGPP
jgi:signal transduction histidine kinase